MNTEQLKADIQTLDNAPCDQPLNNVEQAALDRMNASEQNLGVIRFWEVCASLNIPLSHFHGA